MSIDAKMLVENAALKEKVSDLFAERELLVVLNASLHAKLTTLVNARDDLHATLREALGLMELAAAKERREREEAEAGLEEALAQVRGLGRARAEEWAAIKKKASRQDPDLYRSTLQENLIQQKPE